MRALRQHPIPIDLRTYKRKRAWSPTLVATCFGLGLVALVLGLSLALLGGWR